MKYSDKQRVERIYRNTVELLKYIEDNSITREQLLNSQTIQWTVTTPLYNIGEHANNLSEQFAETHPSIPWDTIAGLRHRLVYGYDDINWEIIADVIYTDLPVLKKLLDELLSDQ